MDISNQTLSGKVALVTGAGRGIGKAIAIAYAQAGASICCTARTQTEIDDTVKAIQEAGGKGLSIKSDVTDFQSLQAVCNTTVETFGGLDILVINAGVGDEAKTVEESDPLAWEQTIKVNLLGAFHCAKAAIPHMKKRGSGKIITIGSGSSRRAHAGLSSYASSKAGLWMFTRVLAQEMLPYGISVNELIPGPVETAIIPDIAKFRQFSSKMKEWMKQPEDVVPLALFLATQPDPGPSGQSFSLMRRDQ